MKFLVSNYNCIHNPWLGGCRPQIPVLSGLCPQLNLLNPSPPRTRFLGTPLPSVRSLRFNVFTLLLSSMSLWRYRALWRDAPIRTLITYSEYGETPVYVGYTHSSVRTDSTLCKAHQWYSWNFTLHTSRPCHTNDVTLFPWMVSFPEGLKHHQNSHCPGTDCTRSKLGFCRTKV
jgi:hypothetical protein